MQTNVLDTFFSPYSREYCMFFYYLMLLSFLTMVMAAFQSFYLIFKGKLGIGVALINIVGPFILYFNNRLLYSMCQASL